jgi:hypothetical protein
MNGSNASQQLFRINHEMAPFLPVGRGIAHKIAQKA